MPISISVIIPAYNAEDFISISIDSILRQVVPVDEIIVVNDGSKDNTGDFVRRKYPNVQVIDQENGGPSKARNTGILISRSDYITFLDADDEWHPEMIKYQKDFFRVNSGIFWWFSNYSRNEWKKIANKRKKRNIIKKPIISYTKGLSIWTGAICIKKEKLISVGLFDENLNRGEDMDVWLRLCMSFPLCGYQNKSLALYNKINSGSITASEALVNPANLLIKKYFENSFITNLHKDSVIEFFSQYNRKILKSALEAGNTTKLDRIRKESERYNLRVYNTSEWFALRIKIFFKKKIRKLIYG